MPALRTPAAALAAIRGLREIVGALFAEIHQRLSDTNAERDASTCPMKPPQSSGPDRITVRQAEVQSGLVPVDARVLLAHVLGVDRAWLAAHAGDPLPLAAATAFFALAKRRRDGEPVAYLTGHREFWGLDLSVTPAVLIPRPETETLVEIALERLDANQDARVLDIGTGSGAVALAIARERPRARVLATDRSEAALAVAAGNRTRLALANVCLASADVYDGLAGVDPAFAPPYALIVSNPPYVADDDRHLREGDLRFEPRAALAAGRDGLDVIRRVVAGAPARLVPGGSLAVEHGHDQADLVPALFETAGFGDISGRRDLAGIRRVVVGRYRPR
jgi:release factor glutamine methyltransferase